MSKKKDGQAEERAGLGRPDEVGPREGPAPGAGEAAEVAHRTLESRRFQSLVERLQSWAMAPANRSWLERATRKFFCRPGGYDDAEMVWVHWIFLSWLIHDHVGPDGRNVRERFLTTRCRRAAAGDRGREG